ncbi:MAG TPA: malonic semialdehyde reductase [Pseudonocardia sp.]|jgi:3-hydroxypropanoate dehydrogenase|nr:malonic semialdehyde reductase [Pseudonocardia sp.]
MTELAENLTVPHLARLDDAGRAALFTEARTSNSFAPTPVTDAELSSIWDLARWPPTAANTQPLRVLYVRTQEGRDRLVPLLAEGNRAKTASAPAVAVLARDTQFHDHIPTVFPPKPELRQVFAENEALRDESGKFGAALQAGYFLLAVRAHGLAAGPMGGFDAAAVDAEFFPDGRWRSTPVVNIGHPGENPWFDRLPRLDHTEALRCA